MDEIRETIDSLQDSDFISFPSVDAMTEFAAEIADTIAWKMENRAGYVPDIAAEILNAGKLYGYTT